MKPLHLTLLLLLLAIDENVVNNVNGAMHHHPHSPKKPKASKHPRKLSPANAPANAPAYAPTYPPSIPSDPSYGPSRPDNDTITTCIFDVTEFGAIGDGATDDTAAFRAAWKAACQVENAVVLAPSGLVFTITSTIFTGPCQPGLAFQVRNISEKAFFSTPFVILMMN